ncbi:conserved hypothetical protein [Mesorhizobium ventifaucium]|uniref:VCBS repeat-containing protein n=2 Tax=Mesorhizobium ventifaucium TaxID=666020 RepID=A0ABM9DDM2_9HYPH|nr:conserved hypothetical protein [Mesorhizobium ventifaucium]
MNGGRCRTCRGGISSDGCWPTTKCSPAAKSTFSMFGRLIAVLMIGYTLASCEAARGQGPPEEILQSGLVFERKEIAPYSGDVKLVGDIDGDSRLDFVLGGFPEDAMSWWRWPDLVHTVIARPHVEFTTDGVLADIDGDGDPDIVTADGPDAVNLVWFENPRPNGNPTHGPSWKRREIGAVGSWGKDIKAADFDGDGLVDIVVRAPGEVMIFFQESPSSWTRVGLFFFNLGEEGTAIGDIDGDADVDLVLHGVWASNPGAAAARDAALWRSYELGPFNPAFKALVTDLDQDGRADILTSSSEHTDDVAWFQPLAGPTGRWIRHVIQPSVAGAHTLQAADMDGDGDNDVVVGQMHTTEERKLAIHYNVDGRGTRWARQVIDDVGLHNGVVADVDRDGDFDIYGANWVGNPPVRVWINRLDPPASVRLDRWTYHRITNGHVRSFGIAFSAMDSDDLTDIISGPFWYRQPSEAWNTEWERTPLAEGVDAVAALDLDGDGRGEVIAQRGGGRALHLVWLHAEDIEAHRFEEHEIGEVPAASHELGSQGHALAQVVKRGKPELAVSSGGGVFYFKIPDDPTVEPWPRTRICAEASDEGIAFADIDGDGLLDLVATTGDAKTAAWWRNPGDGSPDWELRHVGKVPEMVYPDRVAAADLDGDGRADIVVTEENGKADSAKAYWWHNPGDSSSDWEQHEITSRGSLNSLSISDMTGDGRPDLIMGEHRGALRLSSWHNLGGGRFIEQLVGEGMESHLGARTVDLDGDRDLDIVSIAWDAFEAIHVWRNDAVGKDADGAQKAR